jgi:hypothetical protein
MLLAKIKLRALNLIEARTELRKSQYQQYVVLERRKSDLIRFASNTVLTNKANGIYQ